MPFSRDYLYILISALGIITLVMLILLLCYFRMHVSSEKSLSAANTTNTTTTRSLIRKLRRSVSHTRRRAEARRRRREAKREAKTNKTSIETISPNIVLSPTLTPNSVPRTPPEVNAPKIDKSEVKKKKKVTPKVDLQKLSGITNIKTAELTDIYNLPTSQFSQPNDFILSMGYTFGDLLGRGSYASVFKVTRTSDGSVFACKVIDISSSNQSQSQSLKSELFILERVCHPHIIQLHRHFIVHTIEVRKLYIFMQFAQGDSMSAYVRKDKRGQPEKVCKRWFAQVLSAIKHMHLQGIAHRDMKMGNILLDQANDCLVTDFGLSRVAFRRSRGGTILSHKFCGTVPYMAPEVLVNRHYQVDYDPFMADIWAIGVVLYCLVNRGYPFTEGPTMYDQQMAHQIKMSARISFTADANLLELLTSMLHPVVAKRATIDELMKSPWAKEEVDSVEVKAQRFAEIAAAAKKQNNPTAT